MKDLQASISHYIERFGFQLDFASFVKKSSFIDEGLWGFEVTDADGYDLGFFRLRSDQGES